MTIYIGLTGTMLSGKSTALKIFKSLGAATLSADDIVHTLLKTPKVQDLIQKEFGSCDKRFLADTIFANPARKKQLENILHPLVKREGLRKMKLSRKAVVVFEVPLLFEAGWQNNFDLSIVISSDLKSTVSRLSARGVSAADYRARVKTQFSDKEKTNMANIVICNNGAVKDLEVKIKKLYEIISK